MTSYRNARDFAYKLHNALHAAALHAEVFPEFADLRDRFKIKVEELGNTTFVRAVPKPRAVEHTIPSWLHLVREGVYDMELEESPVAGALLLQRIPTLPQAVEIIRVPLMLQAALPEMRRVYVRKARDFGWAIFPTDSGVAFQRGYGQDYSYGEDGSMILPEYDT